MTRRDVQELLYARCPRMLLSRTWEKGSTGPLSPEHIERFKRARYISSLPNVEPPIPSLQLTGQHGTWNILMAEFRNIQLDQILAHQVAWNDQGSEITFAAPVESIPKSWAKLGMGVSTFFSLVERVETILDQPVMVRDRTGQLADNSNPLFLIPVNEKGLYIFTSPVKSNLLSPDSPYFDDVLRQAAQDVKRPFLQSHSIYEAANHRLDEQLRRDGMGQFLAKASHQWDNPHELFALPSGQFIVNAVQIASTGDTPSLVRSTSTPKNSRSLPWSDRKFRAFAAYLREVVLDRPLAPPPGLTQPKSVPQQVETSLDLV